MISQEAIGKAIEQLRAIYPGTSAAERADIVFDHIASYGAPPIIFAPVTTTNGTVAGKSINP